MESCEICFHPYCSEIKYPVTLDCGHTFCVQCIDHLGTHVTRSVYISTYSPRSRKYVRTKKYTEDCLSITCPVCRVTGEICPQKRKKNILVMKLLEEVNQLTKDHSENFKEQVKTHYRVYPRQYERRY